MSAERECETCVHLALREGHATCRQCLISCSVLRPNWTPIVFAQSAPETVPPAPVPQAEPEVVAGNAQPVCDTCGHVALPTAHPTCHQCFFHHDAPPSNWVPIAVVPKAPVSSETLDFFFVPRLATPTEDVVYGYGCQTCKFSAVDPNAAPCRGCWSPSVSGKGSNWTAP